MSTYPLILLPQEEYTHIHCNLSNYFLIRHFNLKTEIPIINDIGEISQEYICSPSSNVGNLSTSLLGHFEAIHCLISLTDKGNIEFAAECTPNYKGIALEDNLDYIIDPTRLYWIIPYNKINSIKIVYSVADKSGKNIVSKSALSLVRHNPVKWNFWHFVLDWQIDNQSLAALIAAKNNEAKKITDKIKSKARSEIARMAKIGLIPHPTLPSECYKVV